MEEGILNCFNLLSTNRLLCQLLFYSLNLADVTNQSKVFCNLSIYDGWHEVKLQM